jgi:phosphatidylinositol-3,4,5-trisphosphate 3-phosphatase and dual-specificity protein phosphatase PTEN
MDFLREIVGGPKNRYREKGYNLDLTYITPRIIAMAFPASGIEKLYRNSIDTIAELLEN